MKEVIEKSLGKKYPQAVQSAITTFDRGFNEVKFLHYELPAGESMPQYVRSDISALGYDTQPIGGVIVNPGNSFLKNLSISRSGMLPTYEQESCINCAECDTVCPDMCFVWEERIDKKGRSQMYLQGIDYQYCKGCLKCVEACPTSALSSQREHEGYADNHTVHHQFDLITQS
jgi:pyruvate ferredoxin oxidoreductase gamma subunit